ncbi:MAG: 3'-5' exonuclease, partial [Pseudomonadota bacterium]
AHGREGRLWAGMMAAGGAHARDAEMLRDMAARAGYLAPYEFLERLFVAHDGRRRLIARLGPEAEDCIDELMAQALAYEARETPSLTGFVTWIEAGDVTLKREMEKGADEVRVMTIHGAKGLEAPIVILPDTVSTGRRGAGTPVLLPLPDQDVTLWAGRAEADDEPAATARAAVAAKAEAEDKRLLYVGLTRAEDWLIFCGAGKRRDADKSWYGVLEQAMAGMGPTQTVKQPGAEDPILRFDSGASPPDAPGHAPSAAVPERPIEPDWLTPVAGEARALRLSPSALGGSGPTPASPEGPEPEEARLRGLAVHLLLERLPEVEARARAAAARALLEQSMPGLAPALADEAIAEAAEILDAPAFAELFAEDSLGEATISLPLPATGGRPMLGRIDRLLVTPRRVLIVDFKTDWHVPDRVADVPAPYLAQMGAYLYACKGVFTDRQVEAGLLWTRARTLMLLPDTVLQNRFASALQQQTGIDLTRGDT